MNSPKKEAGFTLLEILIAIAILAFGILAVATMQATSIKGNSQAIGITEGITLAQDKIEEFIYLDYNHPDISDTDNDGTNQDTAPDDGVDDNGGNFGLDDTDAAADHNPPDVGRYKIYYNIAVDEPINNIKTIRVIVQWTDRQVAKRATVDYMKADIF
ncbi:MAG: prepilin-type N-terminal cleavage/methylation domain-containing protein [Gammaproteobacteria bacterium]|nr:prepilin-type N-terminal cleavage/methylation domain-containing protein [Gammaproteobacteria bacterium]NIS15679.1 prepilin-type N-terminal cleavage/methylation domain-containing protein [candidate division Zixibacteria bacterium]NIW48043.1 prepilin-type N-terminal cleavage/methylation domain-containing protein [Gammaproteobacteria bacterium]